MAEVRGILVAAIRAFLLERYGKSAIDAATAKLVPDEAVLIQRTFLDSSFYPYATMAAMGTLTQTLSPIRHTSGQELGRFIAEHVFKGAYKPLLAKDMNHMVEKIGSIKEFFYRDASNIDSAMTGDTSAEVVYRYSKGVRPTRGACRSLGAFWGRTLELASGINVSGAHPICNADGGDRCEFKYSWV
jgi:hypothetical protein